MVFCCGWEADDLCSCCCCSRSSMVSGLVRAVDASVVVLVTSAKGCLRGWDELGRRRKIAGKFLDGGFRLRGDSMPEVTRRSRPGRERCGQVCRRLGIGGKLGGRLEGIRAHFLASVSRRTGVYKEEIPERRFRRGWIFRRGHRNRTCLGLLGC